MGGMEYLTIKDCHDNSQERLKAAKRKYSYWYADDVDGIFSVAEEGAMVRGQRLNAAKNKHSLRLDSDESFYSMNSVVEDDVSGSYCSDTVSLYDPWLRRAYILTCLSIFFLMFAISYMFFFEAPKAFWDSLLAVDVLYTYIMFLRSRTGYMVDGVEERNLVKVRKKYNRSLGFFFDLLSVIPLGIIGRFFPGTEETFYAVGRQKQYIRLHVVSYYLGIREAEPGSSTVLYRSMRLIVVASLTIHFTACIWFGLACSRYDDTTFSLKLCSEGSWITYRPERVFEKVSGVTGAANIIETEVSFLSDAYATSLYWATATTTSTGYGDVPAHTVTEKIYSIFVMVIGVMVLYGMTMGGITSLLTNIDLRRSTFVHSFKAFEHEVENMKISKSLKCVCLRYYSFLWHRWKGENVQANGVLDTMPEALRARFAEAVFHNLIGKADVLTGIEEACCRNLALVARSTVFLKNEYVQRSGEIASNMCYIHHGIVEVLDEDEKRVIATMHAGKLFGQILLVYDLPRINSIRCKTNCEIFMLDKHDFRQVLSDYPQAALQYVEAVKRKCERPINLWPLEPPDVNNFKHFVDETSTRRFATLTVRRMHEVDRHRKSTVYSTEYTAVDLSRIKLSRARPTINLDMFYNERKPSLVGFSATNSNNDGNQQSASDNFVLAESVSFHDIEDAIHVSTGKTTWRERLYQKALINPDGRFSLFWQNYLFFVSFACGLYTTYLAGFTTTPGQEKTYSGPEILSLDLFDIAYSTNCDVTIASQYKSTCQSVQNWTARVNCVINLGGPLASMISRSSIPPHRVNITIPSSYDTSLIGYNTETNAGIFTILLSYLVFDLSFVLSIIIKLYTEVYTPNGNLTTFKEIFSRYNRWHKLWYDIAAVFPLEIFAPVLGCSRLAVAHAHTLLRLNRTLFFIRNVPATFACWENSLHVHIVSIRTLKLVLYIYSMTHFCACLFYWMSCGYIAQRNVDHIIYKCRFASWGWVYDISYKTSRIEDYIKTIYWASTTMTSTGYGDISPSTNTGRLFAVAAMVVGTVMYGWLVAVVASTLTNTESAAASFRNSMVVTKQFLAVHDVPKALISRVVSVRRIEWYRYEGTVVPGKQCIGCELPDHLHHTMQYESLGRIIEAMPFFHGLDPSFVAMLCNHVHAYVYAEGDIIIYEEHHLEYRYYISCHIKKTSSRLPTSHFEHSQLQLYSAWMFSSLFNIRCFMVPTSLLYCREADNALSQGDLSRNLYVIKSGHCDVMTYDLLEATDHLCPGDYFGEMEVLFGCGSPCTIVADTACEVVVLRRKDIDKVLESFPVLAAQMHAIEMDFAYKRRVLAAIKHRNSSSRVVNPFTDCFITSDLDDGLKYYAAKHNATSRCCSLSKTHCELLTGRKFVVKLLSYMLLPMTFNPHSSAFIAYETVRALLILITAFIVPLQVALSPYDNHLLTLGYILDGLCVLDQYITAHVVYWNHKGVKITHPIGTATHYLKTGFVLDLVSWLPFELIAYVVLDHPLSQQQWRFMAVLRLNRMLQLNKIVNYFSYWLSDISTSRRWLKHISSITYALALHHFCACLLFMAACPPETVNNDELYQSNPDMLRFNTSQYSYYCHKSSWIGRIVVSKQFPALDLLNSVFDQYIISFYWATVTLVSTGYGDVYAGLPNEMVVAIIVQVVGTIYYSTILGDISAGIQTVDIRRGLYKGRLTDVLKFFKVYYVTEETQEQVMNYYCYLWDRTQGVTPHHLLVGLPPSIRTNVCQSMYSPMIKEAFGEGGDSKPDKETLGFFRLLSTQIRSHLYLKGSIVCRLNDIGDEMFFIQRGDVAVLDEDDESIFKVLGPGQHFGEVSIIYAKARARTVKALTNCDLNVLSKKDLDDILEKYPRFSGCITRVAMSRKVRSTCSTTFNAMITAQAALRKGSRYYADGTKRFSTNGPICAKVFDHNSTFIFIWDHITVLFAFISSSMIIYQICFFNHRMPFYVIGYIMDIWFVVSMLISFHKSYLDQFSTTVDLIHSIHLHYAMKPYHFFLDGVSNIPLELLSHAFGQSHSVKTNLMFYGRLNRVLRMFRLHMIFHSWENDIKRNALFFRMYKFLLDLLFITNAVAGGWYAIACRNGICGIHSWTNQPGTNYREKMVQSFSSIPYVDSLYWAVLTMTSTGYGDIKPETQLEMIYACSVTVLGKILIGYVLGTAAATLANDQSLRHWYEQRVSSVKHYMVDLEFKDKLFDHVVQYYDYMWMKNHGVNVVDLFPDLSFSLRADIYNQICRDMIDNLPLFLGCPETFLRHLCMSMVPASFMPGDYICLQGDIRSEMYVVFIGVAEAIKTVDGIRVPLRLLMEGDSFLCESLLCKVRRPCSLRASTYVDVFTMSMEGVQNVLDYHPDAREIVISNARLLYPDMPL